MKAIYAIPAAWITIAIVFLVRMKQDQGSHISITVRENAKTYMLKARYDPANTQRVADYIDSILAPHPVILQNQHVEADIQLEDSLYFHLQAADGKLTIEASKQKNSPGALQKIRVICEGAKARM